MPTSLAAGPEPHRRRRQNLTGYSFETMRQEGDLMLSRGEGQGDSAPLLLLASTKERPSPANGAAIQHIYSLRDELDSSWATRPRDLAERRSTPELVLHDPGGDFLDNVIQRPLAFREFLRLSVSMTKALGRLHARGLVHRDIKPANFLVNARSGEACGPGSFFARTTPTVFSMTGSRKPLIV